MTMQKHNLEPHDRNQEAKAGVRAHFQTSQEWQNDFRLYLEAHADEIATRSRESRPSRPGV